jgi:hypothetical protein
MTGRSAHDEEAVTHALDYAENQKPSGDHKKSNDKSD